MGYEKLVVEQAENVAILLSADYSQGQLPINEIYHPRELLKLI